MKLLTVLLSSLFFFIIGESPLWALSNCVGSYFNLFTNSTWTQCQGSHTFELGSEYEGDTYTGEFNNGKPHGDGTYTYGPNSKLSGDKYIGGFQDGKFQGQGTYIYGAKSDWSGDKYVGAFQEGKFQGQGTYSCLG